MGHIFIGLAQSSRLMCALCSENIRQLKKRSQLRSKIGLYGEKRVVAFPNFPRRFRERVGQFSHGPKQQLHFSYQEEKNWQLLPTTYLVSFRSPEGYCNHTVQWEEKRVITNYLQEPTFCEVLACLLQKHMLAFSEGKFEAYLL